MKIPQLRLISTNYCDSECVYCRPSGEATHVDDKRALDLNMAIEISKLYKEIGGWDVKITGGDPVFWEHLRECVKILKNEIKIPKVEIVTRSTKMRQLVDDLLASGLDSLCFSLDTLIEDKYIKITGRSDFSEYVDVIKFCASKICCKINTVVMKDINDDEIANIIQFCEANKIDEVKFLDIIKDLHSDGKTNAHRLGTVYDKTLDEVARNLDFDRQMKDVGVIDAHRKLGTQLKFYTGENGLNITLKDGSSYGNWYLKSCEDCPYFKCHDAMMAIRLVPDNYLQLCLVNKNNSFPLNCKNVEKNRDVFEKCLKLFNSAEFYENI